MKRFSARTSNTSFAGLYLLDSKCQKDVSVMGVVQTGSEFKEHPV